jgi:hypothetical protein
LKYNQKKKFIKTKAKAKILTHKALEYHRIEQAGFVLTKKNINYNMIVEIM